MRLLERALCSKKRDVGIGVACVVFITCLACTLSSLVTPPAVNKPHVQWFRHF